MAKFLLQLLKITGGDLPPGRLYSELTKVAGRLGPPLAASALDEVRSSSVVSTSSVQALPLVRLRYYADQKYGPANLTKLDQIPARIGVLVPLEFACGADFAVST